MSRAGNSKCLLESKLATPAGCRNGHARAHSRRKANRNRFSSACITPVVRREHCPGPLRDRSQDHVCPDVLCMLRKYGNCKADHPASFDRSGVFAGCFCSEMRNTSLNDARRPDYRFPDAIVGARLFSVMARRLRRHDVGADICSENAVLLTSSRLPGPYIPVIAAAIGLADSRCRAPRRVDTHRNGHRYRWRITIMSMESILFGCAIYYATRRRTRPAGACVRAREWAQSGRTNGWPSWAWIHAGIDAGHSRFLVDMPGLAEGSAGGGPWRAPMPEWAEWFTPGGAPRRQGRGARCRVRRRPGPAVRGAGSCRRWSSAARCGIRRISAACNRSGFRAHAP